MPLHFLFYKRDVGHKIYAAKRTQKNLKCWQRFWLSTDKNIEEPKCDNPFKMYNSCLAFSQTNKQTKKPLWRTWMIRDLFTDLSN